MINAFYMEIWDEIESADTKHTGDNNKNNTDVMFETEITYIFKYMHKLSDNLNRFIDTLMKNQI